MFAVVSAIFFAVAFIFNGAGFHSNSPWFSPTSFMLAGLLCLALSLCGFGANWRFTRSTQ